MDFFYTPAGVAAAIGIIALGGIIKGLAEKGQNNQKAFADGGVVYGPTNALLAEYAGAQNNPEIVAPLSKLQSIIGNSGSSNKVQVEVVGRISNDTIYLANQRAITARNR